MQMPEEGYLDQDSNECKTQKLGRDSVSAEQPGGGVVGIVWERGEWWRWGKEVGWGQIVVCHGKTFVVYSKSNGKPVENFKQGSDI